MTDWLASRVEALTGPSREVDALIWVAAVERAKPGDKVDQDIIGKWPRYTASIDDADTLRPHGWRLVDLGEDQDFLWEACVCVRFSEEVNLFVGRANSGALALAAANLRALASIAGGGE